MDIRKRYIELDYLIKIFLSLNLIAYIFETKKIIARQVQEIATRFLINWNWSWIDWINRENIIHLFLIYGNNWRLKTFTLGSVCAELLLLSKVGNDSSAGQNWS